MADSFEVLHEVQREFKRTAVGFFDQLRRIDPPETTYALLFEIADQTPGAWPIGATEESLSRLASKYLRLGYRAREGDDLELLRIASRWDAPGDDLDGWYWGQDGVDAELNRLIEQTFGQNVLREGDYRMIQKLCLSALRELESENRFGVGSERNQLVVGISNVDCNFSSFLDDLLLVNPPSVVNRLRAELKSSEQVWDQIDRQSESSN